MKRILHALAALWPERREYYNTWLPDARNGLLRHALAVLLVEHAMEELALCKEPKTQPANAPDTDTAPPTNNEPNNRLNLTSRLAGRRITVPGSSEIASLPAKAHLRIRVFANLPLVPAQVKAFIGQGPLRIKANQRISGLAKTNLFTRSQTPLNPGYSLVFAITILFMCLLSAQRVSAQAERSGVPNAFGAEPAGAAVMESLTIGDTIPERDLERFPMVKYDPDLSHVKGLVIGDSIPDYLWDLPLWVVNHPYGRDTITLREYQDEKLLVLDFWARWCAPCVESVDKWEGYVKQYGDGLSLITVHMDYDYKALPFARKRLWKAPVVIGEGTKAVVRSFFPQDILSRVVWIVNGRLIAITGARGDYEAAITDVLAGRSVNVPSVLVGSYSHPLGTEKQIRSLVNEQIQ